MEEVCTLKETGTRDMLEYLQFVVLSRMVRGSGVEGGLDLIDIWWRPLAPTAKLARYLIIDNGAQSRLYPRGHFPRHQGLRCQRHPAHYSSCPSLLYPRAVCRQKDVPLSRR